MELNCVFQQFEATLSKETLTRDNGPRNKYAVIKEVIL